MNWKALGLALGVAMVLSTASTRAEEPRLAVHFDYERGAGTTCPEGPVAAKLLHGEIDFDERDGAQLQLVVSVSLRGALHHVSADLAGQRIAEHEARDCTDALLSALVASATALTLRMTSGPVPAQPPALPPPPPLPALLLAPPPAPPPPPPRTLLPFEILVGVDGVLVVGTTPGPSLGPGPFIALRARAMPLSVEVSGRAGWTPKPTEIAGVHFSFSTAYYSGFLAACARWRAASFCPLVGLGELEHHAVWLPAAAEAPRPFLIVGMRGVAEYAVTPRVVGRIIAELQGLPGSAEVKLYSDSLWRASAGMALGVGVAFVP